MCPLKYQSNHLNLSVSLIKTHCGYQISIFPGKTNLICLSFECKNLFGSGVGFRMVGQGNKVRFSNVLLPFENRTFLSGFEWDLKTGPFHNRTTLDRLKSGHVRISDPHCIRVPNITPLDSINSLNQVFFEEISLMKYCGITLIIGKTETAGLQVIFSINFGEFTLL